MKVGEQLRLPGTDNAGMRMSRRLLRPSTNFACFSSVLPLCHSIFLPQASQHLSQGVSSFSYTNPLTWLAVLGGRVALTGGKAGRMVELEAGGGRGRRKKTAASRQKGLSCVTALHSKHQLQCFCDCQFRVLVLSSHVPAQIVILGMLGPPHILVLDGSPCPWELQWTTHPTRSASFPSSFSACWEPVSYFVHSPSSLSCRRKSGHAFPSVPFSPALRHLSGPPGIERPRRHSRSEDKTGGWPSAPDLAPRRGHAEAALLGSRGRCCGGPARGLQGVHAPVTQALDSSTCCHQFPDAQKAGGGCRQFLKPQRRGGIRPL